MSISVPFIPTMILIKGGAFVSVIWTRTMGYGGLTPEFGGGSAPFSGGILGATATGFDIGSDPRVNNSGTTFYWLAFRGNNAQNFMRMVTYVGNGSDGRQLNTQGVFFTPDIAWIRSMTTQSPTARISAMVGDNSHHFSAAADATDEIQAFIANGVELGQAARVNTSGQVYHMVAWKHSTGVISSGSYIGTGVNDLEVSIGFQPDWVIVKDTGSNSGTIRTVDMASNTSYFLSGTADVTNRLRDFTSNGFKVGTSVAVNTNGSTYWWTAGKTGNFNLPVTRTAV